ncbi:MFS general substrate transporter [Saccharata proteae CBS 121410]|uniref:MFS general substrate transporter n=1 Tax=Saccharata proteae CBS 121410 TaxID=1314787 RepID=A0A9P4HUB1_9PEZI|nr:MFS general substrate transporter [Saccharata proteae CBS 121410]
MSSLSTYQAPSPTITAHATRSRDQITPTSLLEAGLSTSHLSSTSTLRGPEPKWPTQWRAWTSLAGCFFLMFNSWGLVNAYGTFASYYKDTLLPDEDALMYNLFGATQCFVVLTLSIVVGRLLDAGYYRYIICTGAVTVTLSFFLLSVVSGKGGYGDGTAGLIWLTHGFLAGLGMACFFVSSSQIAATWFKAKKSLAIGIVASGASISGLVYPIMLRFLITSLGFPNAVRCVAGLIGLTALFSCIFATPNPAHVVRKPKTWFDHAVWFDYTAFKYKPFVFQTAAISFLFLGFYAVFFNLEEWSAKSGFGYKEGISRTSASDPNNSDEDLTAGIATYWLLALMNGVSTLGRIGSAYLSDHFGALQIHTIVTSVSSLLLLILWTLTPNLASCIAFVVLFGIFSGSVIGLPPASMAYILGPEPSRQAKLGQWTGMMYFFAGVPSMAGPLVAGHLITEYKTYLTVQLWSGACLVCSATCMGCAWWCKRAENLEKAVMGEEWKESEASSVAAGRVLVGGDEEKTEVRNLEGRDDDRGAV